MSEENYFKVLNKIEAPVEKKGPQKLNYISWADAWAKLKEIYPTADYRVFEHPDTKMPYFHDASGGFVKVSVSIPIKEDEKGTYCAEHTVHLPIMDHMNKSILQEKITTFDINKSIQRALAKAIAMHGMGLYVYRGEDFPEDDSKAEAVEEKKVDKDGASFNCLACGKGITLTEKEYSLKFHGAALCRECQKNSKEALEKLGKKK